jgi:hypothetical protein
VCYKGRGEQDTSEQGSVAAFQDRSWTEVRDHPMASWEIASRKHTRAVVHHDDFLRLRTSMAKTGGLGTMQDLAFGHDDVTGKGWHEDLGPSRLGSYRVPCCSGERHTFHIKSDQNARRLRSDFHCYRFSTGKRAVLSMLEEANEDATHQGPGFCVCSCLQEAPCLLPLCPPFHPIQPRAPSLI